MKKCTGCDFELGGKLNGLANLNYTACSLVVPETLEMENENGWKCLYEHLLARTRVTRTRRAVLHRLGPGDAQEGVLNGEYRIRLQTVWRLITIDRTSTRTEKGEKSRHGPGHRDGVIANLLW